MENYEVEEVLKAIYKYYPHSRYTEWRLKKSNPIALNLITLPDVYNIVTVEEEILYTCRKELAISLVNHHNYDFKKNMIPKIESFISTIYERYPDEKDCKWFVEYLDNGYYQIIGHKSIDVWGKNKADFDAIVKIHNDRLDNTITISNSWINCMKSGDENKRAIWKELMESRIETGYPYIEYTDNPEEADYKIEGEIKMNNVKKVWVVLNTSNEVGQESVITIAPTKNKALLDFGAYVLENPNKSYDYVELFEQEISYDKEHIEHEGDLSSSTSKEVDENKLDYTEKFATDKQSWCPWL